MAVGAAECLMDTSAGNEGRHKMDRLPHDPRNLRELVEADLRRALRIIIKIQDEIDPQFRIATPEGDYWIAVTKDVAGTEVRLESRL